MPIPPGDVAVAQSPANGCVPCRGLGWPTCGRPHAQSCDRHAIRPNPARNYEKQPLLTLNTGKSAFSLVQTAFPPIQTAFSPIQTAFSPRQTAFPPRQTVFAASQTAFASIHTEVASIQMAFAPIRTAFASIRSIRMPCAVAQPSAQTGGPLSHALAGAPCVATSRRISSPNVRRRSRRRRCGRGPGWCAAG